jgi:hypothetical protein
MNVEMIKAANNFDRRLENRLSENLEEVLSQSPGLRGTALPWDEALFENNLNEVVAVQSSFGHNLFEVGQLSGSLSRGSSCLATPGFEAQPLRGWENRDQNRRRIFGLQ